MAGVALVLRHIYAWRNYLIVIVTPLILSLFFLYEGTEYQQQARCAFLLLTMVVYWTTECLPIAVTALLPMLMYPLFEIVSAKKLAPKYMSEVNMAFIGTYIMVIAFQNANLHKRFALRILLTVGPKPRWLLFGIMLSASVLSMFTNNTMSCALHLPIVQGIIDELHEATNSVLKVKKSCGKRPTSNPAIDVSQTMNAQFQEASYNNSNPSEKNVYNESENGSKGFPFSFTQLENSESFEMHNVEQNSTMVRMNSTQVVRTDITMRHIDVLTPDTEIHPADHGTSQNPEEDEEKEEGMGGLLSHKTVDGIEKMLLISSAYSASIGGMSTIVGSGTNLVMKEYMDASFEKLNCTSPVNFTSWMAFGFPQSFTFIIIAWFWLQIFFLGPRYVFNAWIAGPLDRFVNKRRGHGNLKIAHKQQEDGVRDIILQLYNQLGPMRFQQYAVLGHCILLVLLLITRRLSTDNEHGVVGWGMIAPKHVKESTVTVFVAALMFIFPSQIPSFRLSSGSIEVPSTLLKWQDVDRELPLGVILLVGGGMAAAYGAQEAGLPALVAPVFGNLLQNTSQSVAVLLTCVTVAGMTEIMSNVACVSLLAPIVEKLAIDLKANPLLYLFPMTFSASFAFMLPVSTPPNALIFSTNRLKISGMVKCGIVMNLIGIVIVFAATTTWGDAYFSLSHAPSCSNEHN